MKVSEWECRRVEVFGDLIWQQTHGNSYLFDFPALMKRLNEAVPSTLITEPLAGGRLLDTSPEYPCIWPNCHLTFTRRDNRREHMYRHFDNKKVAA